MSKVPPDLSAFASWEMKQHTDDEGRVTYSCSLWSYRPYRYGHGRSMASLAAAIAQAKLEHQNYPPCSR